MVNEYGSVLLMVLLKEIYKDLYENINLNYNVFVAGDLKVGRTLYKKLMSEEDKLYG